MNQDKSNRHLDVIDPDQIPDISDADQELLSKIIKPAEGVPAELHKKFYSYVASKKAKDDSELYEILPEEIIKHMDYDYSALAKDFFEEFGDYPELTIVQIGCGRADLLMNLAKLGFKNLYGIDRSRLQVEGAKRKLEEAGIANVTIIHDLVQDYDYSKIGKEIDIVIINNFWGIIDPESSVKLIDVLNKNMSDDGTIYMGPIKPPKNPKKKKSLFGRYWSYFKSKQIIKKIKKKFEIDMIYYVNVDFEKYGFKTEILDFKNAGYKYIRRAKGQS
jgi:2-polyprenyl-3-methyl-5-hydroxy-6-metoxy-1,4-benzoquinol methylase